MLIPSKSLEGFKDDASLSRRVNANSQPSDVHDASGSKLIKKGEC
ncbi:hypothetical protein MCC10025_1488 [Bifidobacterium longum subsp. longum]|nr:hypothetical protein MCC10025_1488 [Bifidobacterium longum subsp. longum]